MQRTLARLKTHFLMSNTPLLHGCRDGLERVQVPDTGTMADMWAAISKALDIPLERMALSKDPKLVSCSATCVHSVTQLWNPDSQRTSADSLRTASSKAQPTPLGRAAPVKAPGWWHRSGAGMCRNRAVPPCGLKYTSSYSYRLSVRRCQQGAGPFCWGRGRCQGAEAAGEPLRMGIHCHHAASQTSAGSL